MASVASRSGIRGRKKSASSNFGGSETYSGDDSPLRSLRKRTMRQEHPFRTDKVEHDLAKKGLKASESDLEERVQDVMQPKAKKNSGEPRKRKKQRRQDSVAVSTSSELVAADVIARTWYGKATEAHIPVKLDDMSSVSELFDKLEASWHSMLDNQRIAHCVASFPWLGKDANIFLLRVDDGTAYGELMREARQGPVTNAKHTVNIQISV